MTLYLHRYLSPLGLTCGLLLMSTMMSAYGDQTNGISIINPTRAYGYQLGDIIEQRISLQRDDVTHSLQQLPVVQREGRWVARNSVSLSDDGRWLDIRYQIINAPTDTRTISLPALSLQTDSLQKESLQKESLQTEPLETDATASIEVPAWTFSISPLLPVATAPNNALPITQPDWQPPAPDTNQTMRRMLGFLAALCLVLLLWAAWWLWRGWIEARSLPFARAWQVQRQYKTGPEGDNSDDAQNWLMLHRAIDQYAGRNVSRGSIDELLQSVRWLKPFRSELHSFYQQSSQRFFSTDNQKADFDLKSLSKRLYLEERRNTTTHAQKHADNTSEVHELS